MKDTLVIFDLDGTILDTLDDLADTMNYVLVQFGYPERTQEEIRRFVGNGIEKLIERAVPEKLEYERKMQMLDCFKAYYGIHCADKTKAYDGIKNVIEQLRSMGYKTAVVSNKADFAVQELCVQYFPGMFDAVVGERTGVKKKPAPDSVFEVMRSLEMDKNKTIYIGDSEVDLETAVNAGIPCIAVDWGFRDRNFLLERGAKRIVSKPEELLAEVIGE